MKSSIKLSIFSFLILGFGIFSCGDEDLVTYQEGGVLKIADAYLDILTPVVSFQAGTLIIPFQWILSMEKKSNKSKCLLNIYRCNFR